MLESAFVASLLFAPAKAAADLALVLRLMVKILHYLKDPKLWALWYIPHYG